jgi:hypothetical protein
MLTSTIPSYLYLEYNDDEDLAAFVTAFNQLAQQYVNWMNQIGLPIYTGPLIVGALLDWVALGLYGIARPSLAGAGQTRILGPLNSLKLNQLEFNRYQTLSSSSYYQTNDDIYKRIITWNYYKGDGYVFNIRWLKRRIMRFLFGMNGTDPRVSQTNQISITFGLNDVVNINIQSHIATFKSGAIFNRIGFNGCAFNGFKVSVAQLNPVLNASILATAIHSGVLELPFQYTYVVNVS